MLTTITVDYTRDGDDWRVTASGEEKTLTGQAPGLIAARDRADQLVEKLAPEAEQRTVVHLLDGDAFAFTTAYLHARHGLTAPEDVPAAEATATAAGSATAGAPTKPGNAKAGGSAEDLAHQE
ncbi:MAG: hypothetical protein ACRDRN_25035 [Sciscionella sp.]